MQPAIDAEAWQAKRSYLLDVREPLRCQDPTCACREAIRLPEAEGRAAKRSQEAAFERAAARAPVAPCARSLEFGKIPVLPGIELRGDGGKNGSHDSRRVETEGVLLRTDRKA